MQAALINRPQPVTVQRAESFIGQIVFASIVFLLCNPVFGLAAFILAGAMNYRTCISHQSIVKSVSASLLLPQVGGVTYRPIRLLIAVCNRQHCEQCKRRYIQVTERPISGFSLRRSDTLHRPKKYRTPKLKLLFDRNSEYKRPAGGVSLARFSRNSQFVPRFRLC